MLIADRLGIRARSFRAAVTRAGRLMPAPARQAAEQLFELEARIAHPKLANRTDPAAADEAAATIRLYLQNADAGKRKSRERAFLGAEIGFRIFVILGLVIAVLVWRGLV